MNHQDKKVIHYPEERAEGMKAVADRIIINIETLPTKIERDIAWQCIKVLKAIGPGPRVSRTIGQFLIDMADESDKQDKLYGTDTNDENQMVCVVTRKKPS